MPSKKKRRFKKSTVASKGEQNKLMRKMEPRPKDPNLADKSLTRLKNSKREFNNKSLLKGAK